MAPFMHGIQAVNSSGGMFEGVDYGTGPNVLLRCRACESAASLIEDELKSHSTPHATPDRHRLQRSWIRGCRSWSGVDTTLQPGSARFRSVHNQTIGLNSWPRPEPDAASSRDRCLMGRSHTVMSLYAGLAGSDRGS